MFDFIMQQLPLGWKLEATKRAPNGKYYHVRVVNRLSGCVYETQSEKSIDNAMTKMADKIKDGGYL